jgi:hypothetical protein
MQMLLLLLISAPLASEAAFRFRFPRVPARAQQYTKILKKYGPDAADIATNLFPPPSPSNDGGSSPGPPAAAAPPSGGADRGPAQTSGLYLVSLQVGTPPQDVSGILDISAQLVWMQCAACTDCVTPPSTIFQPVDSKTLQSVTCDSDVCKASLAQACDQQDNNPCGYVATYGDDDNSQVQLDGVVDVPRTTAARRSRSTPLLAGSLYTDLYYVGLTGVQVGGEEVDGIPAGTFDLQDDGSGGVFLSTTVPVRPSPTSSRAPTRP